MICHSCEARSIVNVLQDYGILKKVKEVADGKGKHTDDIRDEARAAYER